MRVRRWFAKLRNLLWRDAAERELAREITSHLGLLEDEFLRQGCSPQEAKWKAKKAYGGVEQAKELHRNERSFPWLEQTFQDTRFALRSFKRNPWFSFTAILTIAAGISVSTAVFSMVDPLLFRSLPYPAPDQLVSLGVTIPIMDGEFLMANDYFNLRDHSASAFTGITSWTGVADCDLTGTRPQRLQCAQVESSFLPVFGIAPILGQNFTRDDDRPNAPKVALLTYTFWQSHFGSNPKLVGRTISIDGVATRVSGILPIGFELPNLAHVDVVVPQSLAIDHYQPKQSGRPLHVFARLKHGVNEQQALQSMRAFMLQGVWEQLSPALQAEAHVVMQPLREFQMGDVRLASWILFASTLAIMLMVCANISNLLLARSLTREREMTTRAALGASRRRLLWQALTESTMLSLAGAVPGCALAWALVRVFRVLAPTGIPRLAQAHVNLRALAFSAALTFACGLLFGLVSSWYAIRHRPRVAARLWLRELLTVSQVAISFVLLTTATLLGRSLWNLQNVHAELSDEHIVTADITVGTLRHPSTLARQQFFDTLLQRLQQLPATDAVALADSVPPNGFVHSRPLSSVRLAGHPAPEHGAQGLVAWRRVSPEYFRVMGIPILQGRTFQEQDRAVQDNVVMLSQSLASRVFGSQSPVGQQVAVSRGDPHPSLVVGVAADVPNDGIAHEPDPEYYVPRRSIYNPAEGRDASLVSRSLHIYDGEAFVIVRSRAQPEAVGRWIQEQVAALDRTVPVVITTMRTRMNAVSQRPRFSATLLSLFSLVGLILAAGGLYGLTSFLVAQQTRAIGIRMALGATPHHILRRILGGSLRWTILGVSLGCTGSAVVVRWLQSLLFQVQATNVWFFVIAGSVLLAVSLLSAAIPSRRASLIDPQTALRHE